MRIIVDANCCHLVKSDNEDGAPVLKRLLNGKLNLCLSNALKRELVQTPVAEVYTDLMLAGLVQEFGEEVDKEKLQIENECKSNDSHIIALARISSCRLLFSKDKPLHKDFTNLQLVPAPKGKVYQNKTHLHLLP